MIKSRTAQLIFQSVYCTLAVIGTLASLGLFNGEFNTDFYVYYTNLSNYICMGFMFVILYQTAKSANKKEDGYCNTAPTFKFMCVIMIMVTFLVYNTLLAKDKTALEYFTSISNLTLHLILPIMFILNWILFYEHRKIKWYFPLLSLIMPLVYVVSILIRGAILSGKENILLYPYFFLNVDKLGWGGFFMWLAILISIFVIIGYLIFIFDNFKEIKNKLNKNKEKNK